MGMHLKLVHATHHSLVGDAGAGEASAFCFCSNGHANLLHSCRHGSKSLQSYRFRLHESAAAPCSLSFRKVDTVVVVVAVADLVVLVQLLLALVEDMVVVLDMMVVVVVVEVADLVMVVELLLPLVEDMVVVVGLTVVGAAPQTAAPLLDLSPMVRLESGSIWDLGLVELGLAMRLPRASA